MNEIKIFEKEEFGSIRTIVTEDGEPMFCGVDVAKVLGYKKPSDAITNNCKFVISIFLELTNKGGGTNVKFISESDLYRMIMRSSKPEAERFQDWVVEEVLPAIKRTGKYEIKAKTPTTYAEALRMLADEVEEKERLLLEAAKNKPKVDYYEEFMNSDCMTTIREFSNQLNIKERELIGYLIGVRFLYYTKGSVKRLNPYGNRKSFFKFRDCNSRDHNGPQLYITPFGKAEIFKRLKNEEMINEDEIDLSK